MRINQAIREIASQFPTLPIRRRRAIAPTLAGTLKKRHRMPHSVRRHLSVEIDNFDRAIRDFVPGYDTMLRVAAEQAAATGDSGLLLELGAGTGALSEAILAHGSYRAAELIDIDPEMLERARGRLARYGDKVRFKEGSYYDPLPPCIVVATSLALHHVPTMDRKRTLYRRIRDALDPGGVFINADATMSADPDESAETYRMWRSHMASRGVDSEKADQHFKQWSEEDTYFPIDVELDAMTSAGFDARCVWNLGPIAVLVGRKADRS